MARGSTLTALLTGLRAETRTSLNAAHNVQVRDAQVYQLQRAQETLWEDFNWPHLRVFRYLQPQAGQRTYDITGCTKLDSNGDLIAAGDMKIDRVFEMWVKDGDIWQKLTPGITENDYNSFDSTVDQRDWPPRKWGVDENDQIEIWPVPGLTGDTDTLSNMIRVRGVRNLSPLIDVDDTADLDDRLLTLMAASELLSDEEGVKKRQLFERRMLKIRGNNMKTNSFKMFGSKPSGRKLRGPPTVYYRTT